MEIVILFIFGFLLFQFVAGLLVTILLRNEVHWWLEDKWLMLKKVILRNRLNGGDT
jgi:hypothetical protein